MRRLLTILMVVATTLPCWGADDGTLRTSLLNVRTINVATEGTFGRASTTYWGSPTGATAVASGVRRTATLLSCSTPGSTDGIISGECGVDGDAWPYCATPTTIYGVASGDTSKVYKTTDGSSWSALSNMPGGTVSALRAVQLASGAYRLLAWVGTAGTTMVVKYSDDEGAGSWSATTSKSAPGGGDVVWDAAPFYATGLAQHGAYICAGTYTPGGGPYASVFQSADYGANWIRRLNLSSGGGNPIDHFHAMAYHAGLDQWIVDTGDETPSQQRHYYSTDNGETWTLVNDVGYGSPGGQITRFWDYGHATQIVVASDSWQKVGLLDLVSWAYGTTVLYPWQPLINAAAPASPTASTWETVCVAGTWYASPQATDTGANHAFQIYASPDREHWVPYYQPADTTEIIAMYVGYLGGKLHWLTLQHGPTWGHLALTPAKLKLQTGVVLQPAYTQLLTAALSGCGTASGWTSAGTPDSFAVDPATHFLPNGVGEPGENGCLRITKASMATGTTVSMQPTAFAGPGAGNYLVAHAWVKGTARYTALKIWSTQATWNGLVTTNGLRFDGGWTEIWTKPILVAAGNVQPILSFYADEMTQSVDAWLGAIELYTVPASGVGGWNPGGGATTADSLSFAQTLSTDWTLFATINTLPAHDELGTSDMSVLTIKDDADDYVELYWDATNRKWSMEVCNTVPSGSPLATANSRYLGRSSCARFAIRHAADTIRLSVMDGQALEHVTGTLTKTGTYLRGASKSIRYGKQDGSAGMPIILSDLTLYESCLSDDEVETIMEAGAWQRKAGGTGIYINPKPN